MPHPILEEYSLDELCETGGVGTKRTKHGDKEYLLMRGAVPEGYEVNPGKACMVLGFNLREGDTERAEAWRERRSK